MSDTPGLQEREGSCGSPEWTRTEASADLLTTCEGKIWRFFPLLLGLLQEPNPPLGEERPCQRAHHSDKVCSIATVDISNVSAVSISRYNVIRWWVLASPSPARNQKNGATVELHQHRSDSPDPISILYIHVSCLYHESLWAIERFYWCKCNELVLVTNSHILLKYKY